MISSIFYSTENENTYLYDEESSYSLLVHPDLKKVHENVVGVNSYYIDKYKYLKEYGFFKELKDVSYETKIDKNTIKHNISNIRQIIFEVTDYCNLSCQYCSLRELYRNNKKTRKNIDEKRAYAFLKYIIDLKPLNSDLLICFFGGEPLINIEFIKYIVREANCLNTRKSLNLEYMITTNATLLHDNLHFLIDNNFKITISLDGDIEGQSYRVYSSNGKNTYLDVIRNIDELKDNYPLYFSDRVEFNSILTNRNTAHKVYEFIYNRYNKIPMLSQMNLNHVNPLKREEFNHMFNSRKESEREFQETNSEILPLAHSYFSQFNESKSFINHYSINFFISHYLYLIYHKIYSFPTGTCSPFEMRVFYNTHNELLPCEKLNYKCILGEVDDEVKIDIDEIVNKYDSYYRFLVDKCKSCYSGRSCSVCLFTMEKIEKIETGEFECLAFLDENKFSEKLSDIFSFMEKYPVDIWTIVNDNLNNR